MAILMTAGVEQTSVRPVSADLFFDQGERENISFAKSFNERVGGSTLLQERSTAVAAPIELSGLKSATLEKKSDEIVDRPGFVKGKPLAAQEISANGELKDAIADKVFQSQTTAVAGAQRKTLAGDAGPNKVESPAQVEEPADDVSPSAPIPRVTSTAGLTDESLVPQVSTTDGDWSWVPSGGGPVVQKETEGAEGTKESAFAKKTAKAQESAATPKTVHKTVGTVVNAITVETKPIVASSAESAIPVAGQLVAATVALQGEISKTKEVFSKAVSGVAKLSTGVPFATVDGSVSKEFAIELTASVMDTEATVTAGDGLVQPPKPGTGLEKMASAMPAGNDGDSKTQSVLRSATTMVHAMVLGVGVSSDIAPGVVVSGATPGDLTATKLPVGDTGAHSVGLPTGSREQSGLIAASMDGMPLMLRATPTSLEVGIQNGMHGWLKVRAEMTDGGAVNASVSAASSAGQEMLHRELPALTAYLQEEKVAVNAVVVHAPLNAGSESRSFSGMDSAGGQTPQRSDERGEQHQNLRKAASSDSDETTTYRSSHEVDEERSMSLAAYASGGSWLSVRA